MGKGTTNAVGNALCDFAFDFSESTSRAERFAAKRFQSKLEHPDSTKAAQRRNSCWEQWRSFDHNLSRTGLFRPNWAIARLLVWKILREFHLGPVSFTNGSEFEPTLGHNSIESKLSRSVWTCTPDNFDLWAQTVYSHRALKTAFRRRYRRWLASKRVSQVRTDRILWERFKKASNPKFEIFCFKLSCVTEMVQGNRFSTVPKNNEKDRPICVEPLANILVQRRIGLGLRTCLLKYGIDLTTLAERHRVRISDSKIATIDLSNASDSISMRLVKYLLPPRVYALLEQSRCMLTLGLDNQFYLINKISSMGNGFTFELMSLILTALARTYDLCATSFGDDIIVGNEYAPSLIDDLTAEGFVVNMHKTHVDDDYRESCGAHYIDGFGYVESYDFHFPENEMDVITIINKLSRLASIYKSFRPLYSAVYGLTPASWYPKGLSKVNRLWRTQEEPFSSPKLDSYIVPSPFQTREEDGLTISKSMQRKLRAIGKQLHLKLHDASLHYAFEWRADGRSPDTLDSNKQWAKYLMYLHAGRKCQDVILGKGHIKSYLVVTTEEGQTFRWSHLTATT